MSRKYILCYGDSNTHGYNPVNRQRYPEEIRWTGRLAMLLGNDYRIIEEGLNSRTTNLEPEGEPWRSGLNYLEACVRTHLPLDLVVFMLGSNDMKLCFRQTEHTIGENIRRLIRKTRSVCLDKCGSTCPILIVSPMKISEAISRCEFDDVFGGQRAVALSSRLAPVYEKVAREEGCYFLDAAEVTEAGETDGLHLEEEGHRKLALAMEQKIRMIMEAENQ